ncbi:MAG: CapA family protein [Propionibacteriaceae bacterium]|nr:CapA family protein [Propionibacteriaceae bacterium]
MKVLSAFGRVAAVAALAMACGLAACGTPPEAAHPAPPTDAATPLPATAAPAAPTPSPAQSAQQNPPPTGGNRTATVVMNGDLLWHNTLVFDAQRAATNRPATVAATPSQRPSASPSSTQDVRPNGTGLDFLPLLEGIRPVVEAADLAICHNEVPVAKPDGPYSYYPAFRAPQETLDAVKAVGYDLCTTASNHSLDDGWTGLVRTLDAMDARGIAHAGTARTADEAEGPRTFTTAGGVVIAVVTGTYDTNGIPRPKDKAWSVPDLDADTLLRRAKLARESGADIVLVAIHGGDEYASQPNSQQRKLAERLTASADVDLVYGHHVHVVQPWTKVHGKWVIYGLGNLVAQHKSDVPRGYEGVTARFTFRELADGRFEVARAEFIPTLVTGSRSGSPARLYLINQAIAGGKGDQQRLKVALQRTRTVVHSLGGTEDLIES